MESITILTFPYTRPDDDNKFSRKVNTNVLKFCVVNDKILQNLFLQQNYHKMQVCQATYGSLLNMQ